MMEETAAEERTGCGGGEGWGGCHTTRHTPGVAVAVGSDLKEAPGPPVGTGGGWTGGHPAGRHHRPGRRCQIASGGAPSSGTPPPVLPSASLWNPDSGNKDVWRQGLPAILVTCAIHSVVVCTVCTYRSRCQRERAARGRPQRDEEGKRGPPTSPGRSTATYWPPPGGHVYLPASPPRRLPRRLRFRLGNGLPLEKNSRADAGAMRRGMTASRHAVPAQLSECGRQTGVGNADGKGPVSPQCLH